MSIFELDQHFANWAQVIAAVGVIASLIYVARQIRDNTSATRASVYQSLTEHITGITFAIGSTRELAEFVGRVGVNIEPLTDATDALRWDAYAYTVFRNYDNIYFQRTLGVLSNERMDGLLRMAIVFNFRNYPRMLTYWSRVKEGFSTPFRGYVDSVQIGRAHV